MGTAPQAQGGEPLKARYIVDENGKRVSVILPVEEYERMIEELEELEDVRAFDEAAAARERGDDEVIPSSRL